MLKKPSTMKRKLTSYLETAITINVTNKSNKFQGQLFTKY